MDKMKIPTPVDMKKNMHRSLDKLDRTLAIPIVFVGIIIFTAIFYGVNLFLSGLAANPAISGGLFVRGIAEVSTNFPLNITPAGFTFSIWGAIYLLQLGWIVYSLGSLCRRTLEGPVYLHPPVLGPSFFLFFNVSTAAVIAWLFMWDRLLFLAAFVFLAVTVLSLVMTVFSGATSLFRYRTIMIDQGRSLDVKILTVTMLNGVSMFATWTTIATLINLGIILVYKLETPLANETASIICLSILTVVAGIYTVLDATVFRSVTRYNFAPFVTVIWALTGVLSKNLNLENFSSLISIGLLVTIALVLVTKVVFVGLQFGKEQYEYKPMRFGRCVTQGLEEKKGDDC